MSRPRHIHERKWYVIQWKGGDLDAPFDGPGVRSLKLYPNKRRAQQELGYFDEKVVEGAVLRPVKIVFQDEEPARRLCIRDRTKGNG